MSWVISAEDFLGESFLLTEENQLYLWESFTEASDYLKRYFWFNSSSIKASSVIRWIYSFKIRLTEIDTKNVAFFCDHSGVFYRLQGSYGSCLGVKLNEFGKRKLRSCEVMRVPKFSEPVR